MADASNVNPYEINLKNVRISYPHLFEPWSRKPDEKKKYSAVFLLHKQDDKDLIKAIAAKMKALCAEQAKDKRLPGAAMLCMRDGDQSGRPENEGYWTLNASEEIRPGVLNRDKTKLTAEDDVIFPGCFVNAKINLWYQDNSWGKRVNANLLGVQFAKKGERLGGRVARQDAEAMFDSVEGFDDEEAGSDAPPAGDDPFA